MVTFLASFPPIQSAIKIGQDGMRIQLDVPETEMGNAVELLAMRGIIVRVTIEPEVACKTEGNSGVERRRVRKSKWTPAKIAGNDGDTGDCR